MEKNEGCKGFKNPSPEAGDVDCEYPYAGGIICEGCIFGGCGGKKDPRINPDDVLAKEILQKTLSVIFSCRKSEELESARKYVLLSIDRFKDYFGKNSEKTMRIENALAGYLYLANQYLNADIDAMVAEIFGE